MINLYTIQDKVHNMIKEADEAWQEHLENTKWFDLFSDAILYGADTGEELHGSVEQLAGLISYFKLPGEVREQV